MEVQQHWAVLGGDDPERAGRSIWALSAAPAQAVPFLKERLSAGGAGAARIARLIADLDAEAFAAREQASNELAELGKGVEPALQKALQANPSAEARRRIQELLQRIKGSPVKVNPARGVRALEILEHIGNPDARQVLEALAKGEEKDELTRQARFALDRLARRAGGAPR